MKLIHLFLIALILQPCPVCWGDGIAAVGQCENGESAKSLSAPACCTHSCHSQKQNQSQQHDPQHDCPCVCHVTDVVYALTASSTRLCGITTPLNKTVDVYCQSMQNTVANNRDMSSSSLPITVPLRI